MNMQTGVDQPILHDPEALLTLFQDVLRPANGSSIRIRSCETTYSRDSPTRSVAQYTVGILDEATGQEMAQVVTATTFGPSRTHTQWQRVLEGIPGAAQSIGPLALPAATYVPEHELIVQVFPFDFRLPGLVTLLDGSAEVAASLIGAAANRVEIERWEARVVRYRPDMRGTIHVNLQARDAESGAVEARCAYAKVYRDLDEGRHAYRLLQALHEQTASERAAFSVPRPIAYLENLQTLLVSEVAGDRLLETIRRSKGTQAIPYVRRGAQAVAAMHQLSLPDGLLPEARRDKREQLASVAVRLARQDPDLAQEIDSLVAAIGNALEDPPLAPAHYDLKQGHILIDGDEVVILDFDKMAMGDPLVDVGNIVATLGAERDGSQARAARRAALVDAFVDEYFAHVPSAWRAQFPAHFAAAALIEAGTTGRGQRGRQGQKNRADWVRAAIAQARSSLNGDLWR